MAFVAISTLGAGTVGLAGPASAAIKTVVGSAYGIYSSVGFSGATPQVVGPTPKVTLPAGGSATPVTATAASESVVVGPGDLFSSGPVTVTTQGTPATGSVTSSAKVLGCTTTNTTTGCTAGQITENPFTATAISSACTANGSTATGSVTITNGVLADEVNGSTTSVPVPAKPTPNETFAGTNPSTGAPYKFVFNEQITNSDGSLTVNAVHQTLNATLAGTQIVGEAHCGALASAGVAPAITSAAATTFTVGKAGTFTVTATGTPSPTITESGALPGGVSFANGVLSGTPAAGSAHSYPLVFIATNGVGSPARQNFTLTVAPGAPPVTTTTTTLAPSQVGGSAFGYYASVSLFGGPPSSRGPTPTVSLPAGGSATPVTASAASGSVVFGPATIFVSGPITVSTQGTPASGSVTSSSRLQSIGTAGGGGVTANQVSSTCTANRSGTTGSTTITNGSLVTSTDANGNPATSVALPTNPPPNYTVFGTVNNVGGSFKYVFNEQIVNPNGSITVNAGHEYIGGGPNNHGPALGDLIYGQSVCARSASASLASANLANTTGASTPAAAPAAAASPAGTGTLAFTGIDLDRLIWLALLLLAMGCAAIWLAADIGRRKGGLPE